MLAPPLTPNPFPFQVQEVHINDLLISDRNHLNDNKLALSIKWKHLREIDKNLS